MKIYIIGKTKKINIEKNCKSIFYKSEQNNLKQLSHDTIQLLKCVVHYLNMKMKEKSVEIVDLQLCSSLK